MKKNIAFIFVLTALGILMSCKQDPAQMILGTWKLSNIESTAAMNNIEKQMFKETNADLLTKEKYIFAADKLTLTYDKTDTKAAWQLGADGKTLKITMPDDKEFNYKIVELSQSKLVWSEDVDGKYTITTSLTKEN
jgi:hypothetical protein